jgi:uncharacterized protein
MLIRFKVANYLSFNNLVEFSMAAGRERIHSDHVIRDAGGVPNLLRAALLYGANGAGKSNFVRAIEFARTQVVSERVRLGSANFPYNPHAFKLDPDLNKKPSFFQFEFVVGGIIYEYGFNVRGPVVEEEWLNDLTKEKTVFHRTTNPLGESEFEETKYVGSRDEKDFLAFVQKSIVHSQLFLTHAAANNVKWLIPVYEWFSKALHVVYPSSTVHDLADKLNDDGGFRNFFTEFMSKAGTGIRKIHLIEMKQRKRRPVVRYRSDGEAIEAKDPDVEDEFENVLHLYLEHDAKKRKGHIPLFLRFNESDGTQRLFDLMAPLYDLVSASSENKVYIIDELERSLHANVSYMLLKSYLEECSDNNNQLIATTHQTHLLDLNLLRRDEIWFAEKDPEGATQLYSLYEFNPRYDKKIEKEYLTGRFGAIPFLGNMDFKRKLPKKVG